MNTSKSSGIRGSRRSPIFDISRRIAILLAVGCISLSGCEKGAGPTGGNGGAGQPASITATAGIGQSATISTAFTTALQATVEDASGNFLPNITVTFMAPASGASGTFANGTASTTAITNSSGIATASTFTANGTPGPYSVTASVAGLSTTATFSLTNNNVPATITVVSPSTGQPGQTISVTINGLNTNFSQGTTLVSLGPGISVGGAPEGTYGPVTVNSTTSLAARIAIDSSQPAGTHSVSITSGGQQISLNKGFAVFTSNKATTESNGQVQFPEENLTVSVVDVASQQPLSGMQVVLIDDGTNQSLFVSDPTGTYLPALSLVGGNPDGSASVKTKANFRSGVKSAVGGTSTWTVNVINTGYLNPTDSTISNALSPADLAFIRQSAQPCPTTSLGNLQNEVLSQIAEIVAEQAVGFAVDGDIQDAVLELPYGFEVLSEAADGLQEADTVYQIDGPSGVLQQADLVSSYETVYPLSQTFYVCSQPLQVSPNSITAVTTIQPTSPPPPPASGGTNPPNSGIILGSISIPPSAISSANVGVAGPTPTTPTIDSSGNFTASNLAPGLYNVSASAPGFVPQGEIGVTVQNGTQTPVNINLAPYSSTSQPFIQSVTPILAATNQGIIISGTGFGNSPPQTAALGDGSVDTLACNVATPSIAIDDSASGSDAWAAGRESCTNLDAIGLNIVSWSDTQIVLNGFGSALGNAANPGAWNIAPGDSLTILVFGPNNSGTASYNLPVSPAAPVSLTGSVTLSIPANQAWTDTGLSLNVGDTVAISASGLVILTTDGHIPPMSPAGFPPNCTAAEVYGQFGVPFPAFDLPCWSLIGSIGANGAIFEVGTSLTFQVQTSGEFYLGMNDNNLGDNSGSWTASVSVTSSNSSATPSNVRPRGFDKPH